MTYIIRRGATHHFRYRLHEDIRGRDVPRGAPANLAPLVNEKTRKFKHEYTESLRTTDKSVAKTRVGILISRTELLINEARQLLTDGPRRTLSEEEVSFLAERRVAELLEKDASVRRKGMGINLDPMREAVLATLRIPDGAPPSAEATKSNIGMSDDDLDFITFLVDRGKTELRGAVARQRPPQWVRSAVEDALKGRGIELDPQSEERETLDLAFLEATQRAFDAMAQRNAGMFVRAPQLPNDPTEQHGPRLSQVLEGWKLGTLVPGVRAPAPRSIVEAEYSVRRFRELHGDLRIGEVTREHARTFRDAMWSLPTRMPTEIERQPLPIILKRHDLATYPRRSSGTLGKHITMIHAVIAKAASALDLEHRRQGWINPFKNLKPANEDERDRDPFSLDELRKMFSSSIFTKGERPTGGQGDAAFWLPVLAVMTGARLGELAQLRVCDVMQDNGEGSYYFDVTDEGESRRLKTKNARRRVPVHPVLIRIGLLDYLTNRQSEVRSTGPLFAGLEPRGKSTVWGGAWSKWFSRYRRDHLGINGAERRKDFHSFRHNFSDLCREARLPEEERETLTGRSLKGLVGRRYGDGVPLSVLVLAMNSIQPPAILAKLRWRPAH